MGSLTTSISHKDVLKVSTLIQTGKLCISTHFRLTHTKVALKTMPTRHSFDSQAAAHSEWSILSQRQYARLYSNNLVTNSEQRRIGVLELMRVICLLRLGWRAAWTKAIIAPIMWVPFHCLAQSRIQRTTLWILASPVNPMVSSHGCLARGYQRLLSPSDKSTHMILSNSSNWSRRAKCKMRLSQKTRIWKIVKCYGQRGDLLVIWWE